MKPDLTKYENKKICVAVSGGRDSMALLHYLHAHAKDFNITLSALNCDHCIRGEESARDSAFVEKACKELGVPLLFFRRGSIKSNSEAAARAWRIECYKTALKPQNLWEQAPERVPEEGWQGADAIATAHHLGDNAETVLFNLARGSGLAGLTGITDTVSDGLNIIRPLIGVTRAEIEAYIAVNGIKYVDDETNFTDGYTRNRIRAKVLPELENAVHGAAGAIYRFSRLAAEDEDYFDRLIASRNLVVQTPHGVIVSLCEEKAVFKRAAIKALKIFGDIRDYTAEHAERLFNLQYSENGRKFEFLNFTAYKEEGGIALCRAAAATCENSLPFSEFKSRNRDIFGGQTVIITDGKGLESARKDGARKLKTLKFDLAAMPENAVVRFMREGDRFTKFGGGTKSLGDWFTDKKIPQRIRKNVPLIAVGADIYAVCGVEISDKIRITAHTKETAYIISEDYGG